LLYNLFGEANPVLHGGDGKCYEEHFQSTNRETWSWVWNLPSIRQYHDKILCWGTNSCWNSLWRGCCIQPQLNQII